MAVFSLGVIAVPKSLMFGPTCLSRFVSLSQFDARVDRDVCSDAVRR